MKRNRSPWCATGRTDLRRHRRAHRLRSAPPRTRAGAFRGDQACAGGEAVAPAVDGTSRALPEDMRRNILPTTIVLGCILLSASMSAAPEAVAASAGTSTVVELGHRFAGALEWAGDLARSEPVAFFAVFVAGSVAFAPGSAFSLAAGIAYGVWLGLLVSLGATIVVAAVHFVVVRRFFRDRVHRRLSKRRVFGAIDRAVADDGWKIVGLTRASALIPGAAQNVLYAVTRIRLRTFLFATLMGVVPPTLLCVITGSTGDSLLSGRAELADSRVLLGAAALVPLVIAIRLVVRGTRRHLAERLSEPGPSS